MSDFNANMSFLNFTHIPQIEYVPTPNTAITKVEYRIIEFYGILALNRFIINIILMIGIFQNYIIPKKYRTLFLDFMLTYITLSCFQNIYMYLHIPQLHLLYVFIHLLYLFTYLIGHLIIIK